MNRLERACDGKAASAGGLNLGELRKELIRRFPQEEQLIRQGTRFQVEQVCQRLLAQTAKPPKVKAEKVFPPGRLEQVFPPEILRTQILPQLAPREARLLAFTKPALLKGLSLKEQCRYLTEQKALCEKKLIYNLPALGPIDCSTYCFTVYQRIAKRAFAEMQALGAKELEKKYGLPNDFHPDGYPIFGYSEETYGAPAGSYPKQYVNKQTFVDYLIDHIDSYPEGKEIKASELEDVFDALPLWHDSENVKELADTLEYHVQDYRRASP